MTDTDLTILQPGDLDPIDFVIENGVVKLRQGGSSPADSDKTYIAAMPISGQTALMIVGGSEVEAVDTSILFAYAGVALTAAQTGDPVKVRRDGVMASDTWQWVPTLPIFAGPAGSLTQTAPSAGYAKLLGYALDAQTIFLAPEVMVKL